LWSCKGIILYEKYSKGCCKNDGSPDEKGPESHGFSIFGSIGLADLAAVVPMDGRDISLQIDDAHDHDQDA